MFLVFTLCRGSEDVLYYSVRSTPSGGPRAPPLTGPKIENDLPTQEWDERLLGQIDNVEAGTVSGWACLKGQLAQPLQVSRTPACNSVQLSLCMRPNLQPSHGCPAAYALLASCDLAGSMLSHQIQQQRSCNAASILSKIKDSAAVICHTNQEAAWIKLRLSHLQVMSQFDEPQEYAGHLIY